VPLISSVNATSLELPYSGGNSGKKIKTSSSKKSNRKEKEPNPTTLVTSSSPQSLKRSNDKMESNDLPSELDPQGSTLSNDQIAMYQRKRNCEASARYRRRKQQESIELSRNVVELKSELAQVYGIMQSLIDSSHQLHSFAMSAGLDASSHVPNFLTSLNSAIVACGEKDKDLLIYSNPRYADRLYPESKSGASDGGYSIISGHSNTPGITSQDISNTNFIATSLSNFDSGLKSNQVHLSPNSYLGATRDGTAAIPGGSHTPVSLTISVHPSPTTGFERSRLIAPTPVSPEHLVSKDMRTLQFDGKRLDETSLSNSNFTPSPTFTVWQSLGNGDHSYRT
jgi:hypothetical protein